MKLGNPSKLRSGEWGARVFGDEAPEVGEKIRLETQSGSTRTVYVVNCFWSGPDKYNDGQKIHLCETSDSPISVSDGSWNSELFARVGEHLKKAAAMGTWDEAKEYLLIAGEELSMPPLDSSESTVYI